MGLEQEWQLNLEELFYLIEEAKEDKDFLHNECFEDKKKRKIII